MLKLIKLTVILLLLVSANFAQSPFLTLMADDGVSYDSDAQTYFNATSLSKTQQDRINTLVVMLKDTLSISMLSDKFDLIYLMANEDSVSSKLNLVKRSFDGVKFGTNIFTQWQGWAGDGGTGYINTRFNPSSDATNFTVGTPVDDQNSSFGIYSRTNSAATMWDMGCYNGTSYFIFNTRHSINASLVYYLSNSQANVSNMDGSGFFIAGTNGIDGQCYLFKNGSLLQDNLTASTSIPNYNIYLGAYNNQGSATGFSNRQLSIYFIAGRLTPVEIRGINNCFEWYMDELGTGVQ